jgi:hypothetical protein
MPVTMVRNRMAGPTVFVDNNLDVQIEWGGFGDPAGNDIQPVPESVLTHPQFMRSQRRGIFEEVSEEEAAKALDLQTGQWQERMERDANAGQEVLMVEQQNDIVLVQCIGPHVAGRGQCPEQVQQKVRDRYEEPPLCRNHRGLKDQFVSMPDPSGRVGEHGRVATVWVRPTSG